MDTTIASDNPKPKVRRRRRKNKLKPDSEKQTFSENVPTTSKIATHDVSQPSKSGKGGGHIKGKDTTVLKSDISTCNKKLTISKNMPTTKKTKEMLLRPSDIRYSQSSIACKFSDETNIGTLLDDIWCGRCFASAVPMIKVSLIKNRWVSADNRRLWVFKQLEFLSRLETITVKVVKKIYGGKLTSGNAGLTVTIRGIPSGIVYTALNQISPDQYPLKSKKNRRKRKAKPKTNENESAIIDTAITSDESLTDCQYEDDDNSNNATNQNDDQMYLQVIDGAEQYSSECDYSDFEYSEWEDSGEDNINYDYTSSDDTSANSTDTDNSPSPSASVTHDGTTLSSNFSNLQLHQLNNNRPCSTREDNLNETLSQRPTQSKPNDPVSTKVPLSLRSADRATFQQSPLTASTDTERLLYGQGTSSTRNNASSYGHLETSNVAKQTFAKHHSSVTSSLWSDSRKNTRIYGDLQNNLDDLEKTLCSLNYLKKSEYFPRQNTERLVSKSVTRDNVPKKPHTRGYQAGGMSYEIENYYERKSLDRFTSSRSKQYDGNVSDIFEHYDTRSDVGVSARSDDGVSAWSDVGISARSDVGVSAQSDVGVKKKTQRSHDSYTETRTVLCGYCKREQDECECFQPGTTGAANNNGVRKPDYVRKPGFLDTVLEGINVVGYFLKKFI